MSSGVYVVLGAVVLALVAGGALALRNGRFRGTHAVRGATCGRRTTARLGAGRVPVGGTAGRARHAAAVLLGVLCPLPVDAAGPQRHRRPGAGRHATSRSTPSTTSTSYADSSILRTPTTLVLDADGHEVVRASGAPTKAQVYDALAAALP